MRVALSIMPIDSSTGKPKRLPAAGRVAAVFSALSRAWPRPASRGASQKIAAAAARPTSADDRQHRLPRQQHQHQRGRRRHRHLADVAGEIVGAERLHRARPGKGAGDQRRGERMLRAGAEPADQQRDHQRPEADAGARDQIAEPDSAVPSASTSGSAEPLRQQRRRNLEARPWCRKSRCAAGRARHSRCRTRPARAAA